jgi:hypothetical protein
VYATDEPEEDDEGVVVEDLRSDSRRNFDNWAGVFLDHADYQLAMSVIKNSGALCMLINNRHRIDNGLIEDHVFMYTLADGAAEAGIGIISQFPHLIDDDEAIDVE